MKYNPNKTVIASKKGITILYTDSCKHQTFLYEEKKENILTNLQLHGNKISKSTYHERSIQNNAQEKAYRLALYGLSALEPEEKVNLTFLEKNKIVNNHKKVQTFLDKWKQDICHKKLEGFLKLVFHKSTLAKELADYPDYYDQDNINKINFRRLGITKEMVEQKLILAQLLPSNYYELK